MAGTSISVRADGQAAIERRILALHRRFGDLSELMDRFGTVLETSTIERFDDERDPEGNAWVPSIRAREEGGKTLSDQGLLKQSIHFVASADRVEIGSNLPYARPHQEGAVIRGRSGPLRFRLPGGLGFRTVDQVVIPKRSFIGLSADDREELEAQTVEWLAEVEPDIES